MATAGCRKLHNRCCQTLCCRLWINVSLVLRPAPGKPTLLRRCECAPRYTAIPLCYNHTPMSSVARLCHSVSLPESWRARAQRALVCLSVCDDFPGRWVCVRELCQCYVDRVPFSNVHVGKLVNRLSVWGCLLLWVRSEAQRRRRRRRAPRPLFVLLLLSFRNSSLTAYLHTLILKTLQITVSLRYLLLFTEHNLCAAEIHRRRK